MPGFVTAQMEEAPDLSVPKKSKKIIATVLIATVALVAVPTASAGSGNHVPNPGWEVD